MSDFQLNLESKTEMSVEMTQNYMGGGDTPHSIDVNCKGRTPHILPKQGDKMRGHCT